MGTTIGIVGAGVGGLATAARLSSRGYDVEVFEKLAECGGRNHLLEDQGFKFDMGPSFVLMPDFFEEPFTYCGEDLRDYLDLRVLDPSYKIFYHDGETLTVYRDSQRTKEELERIERGAASAYDNLMNETKRIYEAVRPLLYKSYTSSAVLNPRYWFLLRKIRALESCWHLAKRYVKSDELAYALTFQAMFLGVSPYKAPAFYSMINYADQVQKIHHPMGGMYQIALALERLANKFGAKFNYNCEVSRIRKVNGLLILDTAHGEAKFEKVVVNADYAYGQTDLLGRSIPDYEYSCSVYLMYLGLRRKVNGLAHHNLFFSQDVRRCLREIFDDKVVPDDPSFYVHVPTVTDDSLAPPGKDLLYILVPVPNLQNPGEEMANREERLREIVFKRISETLGAEVTELTEVGHKFCPQDFTSRYNIKYGATFGLAHTLRQSAFFRPHNQDQQTRGLYFVGASTQPGGGLPPVLASSRIVADLITGRE